MENSHESSRFLIISEQNFDELKSLLLQLLDEVRNNGEHQVKEWLSEEEARKLIPRGRTWFFNQRKKGFITATKIGGQPYYSRKSLLRFIERHRKNAYRNLD